MTKTPAGAKSTAEAAELRKAGADWPQSKAQRGPAADDGQGMNCGRTAEELRKLIAPVSTCTASGRDRLALALALVRSPLPERPRESSSPSPCTQGGAAGPLVLHEPPKGGPAERPSACPVLTHPAFDRPPVRNERRPGPKRGAVSIAQARRQRQRVAFDADRQAEQSGPPHDLVRELLHSAPARAGADRAAGLAGDDAVIAEALARLDARLRRPGAVFDAPERVRAFLALQLAELEREVFGVLFLTSQHALIAFELLSVGTLTQTAVYPREVVRRALALNAGAVILTHNHPSGLPEPSRADELLTASLRQALALVDVRILDHCIVGRLQVVSMAERGML